MKFKLFILAVALVFASCNDDKGDGISKQVDRNRTIFVYLAMDHNLSGSSITNLNSIIEGTTYKNVGQNNIIVFHDRENSLPELIRITANKKGTATKEVIKVYSDDPSSAAKETFAQAVKDMQQFAPADNYILVMGSHASGWLPGDTGTWKSRAVAQDRYDQFMELSDFVEVLPAGLFDLILFDECYMAGAEVIWPVSKKTKYIIASAAEVLGSGMPYAKIIPYLFYKDVEEGALAICQTFYSHYNNESLSESAFARSVTTSLFDCSKVDNQFANLMKQIMETGRERISELTPNSENIQFYDRYNKHVIYDIKGFAQFLSQDKPSLYAELADKLDEIIIYKEITRFVFSIYKDRNKYSGMTVYIPFELPSYEFLNEAYTHTEWYQRVYADIN